MNGVLLRLALILEKTIWGVHGTEVLDGRRECALAPGRAITGAVTVRLFRNNPSNSGSTQASILRYGG